jgi:proline dehydrogenase
MEGTLVRWPFVQRGVRRFMPGEHRESALAAASALASRRIGAVFTFLGEKVSSVDQVQGVVKEYLDLLEEIHGRALRADISVKPTQLGLDLDRRLVVDSLRTLLPACKRSRSTLWIDMEATRYLEETKSVFSEVVKEGNPVGLCLQAYLRSGPDDLMEVLGPGTRIRVVKGAYAEPASLALTRRREVDAAYFELVKLTLSAGGLVAVATHDSRLVSRIRSWMRENAVPRHQFEFQMLFGVRGAEQERLAREGEPIRVLISYGPSWFPWYMRRLAERPANLWLLTKNLFLP